VEFGLLHLIGGLIVGIAIGLGARIALRRLQLPSASSYPVLALAIAGLSYGVATELGASGFLAVYLAGVVLGRKRLLVKSLSHFHEGLGVDRRTGVDVRCPADRRCDLSALVQVQQA